jgi:vacuolar-type H+-ATPase subunit I/STV1
LDLLGRSGSSITSSLASAAQLEQDLAKRADSLGEQDMLLRKQISDLQLDKKKQDIDKTKEHLDDTKAYVDTEAKSLGAEIGKVKNLNYELNKAKTVEFIFLQAGEAREIKVTDYKHPENPAQDITFIAKKIRRFLDLAVVVGQGQEQAFGYLNEEVEKQIPGTDDLWFKVEAIRRRYLVFARPFAILRIYVKAKS